MLVDKPCRVKGNGEIIEPLKSKINFNVLIVKPFSGCATKDVFNTLDYKNIKRVNINKLCDNFEKNDMLSASLCIGNSLVSSAINIVPEIEDILNRLKACDFEIVSMSGSGSTCFAISKRKYPFKKAKELFDKSKYSLVEVCRIKN